MVHKITPNEDLVLAAAKAHGAPALVHDIDRALREYLFHCENNNMEGAEKWAGELHKLFVTYEALTKVKITKPKRK